MVVFNLNIFYSHSSTFLSNGVRMTHKNTFEKIVLPDWRNNRKDKGMKYKLW